MDWFLLSLTFRWPHQGIMVGYEVILPKEDSEDLDYTTVRLHLTLITLSLDFG